MMVALTLSGMGVKETHFYTHSEAERRLANSGEFGITVRLATREEKELLELKLAKKGN